MNNSLMLWAANNMRYTKLPALDKTPQYNDDKNKNNCETQGDDDINKRWRKRSWRRGGYCWPRKAWLQARRNNMDLFYFRRCDISNGFFADYYHILQSPTWNRSWKRHAGVRHELVLKPIIVYWVSHGAGYHAKLIQNIECKLSFYLWHLREV